MIETKEEESPGMSDAELIEVDLRAPDFLLPAKTGENIALSDYRGKQPVVLFFTREFTCPQCRMHSRQLAAAYEEIQALGAEVLVLGAGTVGDARCYAERLELPYPVLADVDRSVYERYLLQRVFFSLIQRSAVFLIDREGTIRYAHVSTNRAQTLQLSDLIAALEGLERTSEEASRITAKGR